MLSMLIIGAAAALQASPPPARPPGTTRTDLQRHDLSVRGWESLQALVSFAPGSSFPPHKHPGEEIIYVTQGTIEYEVNGKLITVKAGEVLFIPYGVVHAARNPGEEPAAELATYVIEKGKPLVVLAE
ncbi:MAG TPA: cupin domain-containing protein [Sphingomicrobium sp.]|nr:cupin domain-containing protein [Sphingomicrobium sp.]